MSKCADFYYKHEPAKFNAKTAMLSAAEKGAYIVLLNLMYMRGGPIDNDSDRLPGAIGCTKQAYRKILGRLIDLEKIAVTADGKLTNDKAEKVMAARSDERQKRRQAGRKGGEKQVENRRELAEKVAEIEAKPAENNDLLGHSQSQSKSTPQPSVGAPKPDSSRGTRLAKDWQPSTDLKQYALDRGLNPDEVLEDFRDYWTSASGRGARKLDWDATWRMRCRDLGKKQKRPSSAGLTLLSMIHGGKAAQPDPNDPWGIQGWFSTNQRVSPMPDTASDDHKKMGKWVYGRKVADRWAREIAEAAGWSRSWRGDWSPMLGWIDLGIPLQDVCAEVARTADSYRSRGDPAQTLKAFDHSIRNRRAAA